MPPQVNVTDIVHTVCPPGIQEGFSKMTKLDIVPNHSRAPCHQMRAGRLRGVASLPAGAEEAVVVFADDIGGEELEEIKRGNREYDPV